MYNKRVKIGNTHYSIKLKELHSFTNTHLQLHPDPKPNSAPFSSFFLQLFFFLLMQTALNINHGCIIQAAGFLHVCFGTQKKKKKTCLPPGLQTLQSSCSVFCLCDYAVVRFMSDCQRLKKKVGASWWKQSLCGLCRFQLIFRFVAGLSQ